jgi:hypothetical protein
MDFSAGCAVDCVARCDWARHQHAAQHMQPQPQHSGATGGTYRDWRCCLISFLDSAMTKGGRSGERFDGCWFGQSAR